MSSTSFASSPSRFPSFTLFASHGHSFASRFLPIMLLVNLCVAQPGEFLHAHNVVRMKVGVPLLSWSDKLANYAINYSRRQSQKCRPLTHSHGKFGENLFWGSAKVPEWTASEAVAAWADEVRYYDYTRNSCTIGHMCGHYTQIVWHTTREVGCAHTKCADGADYIICSYDPPGNWIGEHPF